MKLILLHLSECTTVWCITSMYKVYIVIWHPVVRLIVVRLIVVIVVRLIVVRHTDAP